MEEALAGGAAVKITIFRGLRATGETGQGISGTHSDGTYTAELLPVYSHLIQEIFSFYSRNICNLLGHLFSKQTGFQINRTALFSSSQVLVKNISMLFNLLQVVLWM